MCPIKVIQIAQFFSDSWHKDLKKNMIIPAVDVTCLVAMNVWEGDFTDLDAYESEQGGGVKAG